MTSKSSRFSVFTLSPCWPSWFCSQGGWLCLDTSGASTSNGVQLDIYIRNRTGAQAFKLVAQ